MRVVVVDPSRTVLKAVSRLLAKDGHEVSTFIDGPEALAARYRQSVNGSLRNVTGYFTAIRRYRS